jgi:hypothetical protein
MKWLLALGFLGCAGSGPRPPACTAPAERAEVAQIQVGWNAVSSGRPQDPPVVNMQNPQRYEPDAERLAQDLLARCRRGEPFAPLQEKFSEVSPGTSVIGASSDAPYREAALCLQPGECAVVHGPSAWHVLKRVN